MKKRFAAQGLMFAMWVVGAAWAGQPAAAIPVTGHLTSVNAMAKTFTIDTSGGRIAFTTDGRTMLTRRDRRVSLADLKVRERVRVTYVDERRKRIARLVDASGEPFGPGTDAAIVERNGSTDFSVRDTGDPARIQLASDSPAANPIHVVASGDAYDDGHLSADGRPRPGDASSRRLLGLWGLAMIGTVLVLRARRPLTI